MLSGGLDSAAALAFVQAAGGEADAVFIDYGQAARAAEQEASQALASHFGVAHETIRVQHGRQFGAGEIVGRNSFLIMAAVCFAPFCSGTVVTGIHAGTNYYDCSGAFLSSISRLVEEQSDGAFRVLAPFESWSKDEVIAYARGAGIPLNLTYSCEAGSTPPCGACASCRDRSAL